MDTGSLNAFERAALQQKRNSERVDVAQEK